MEPKRLIIQTYIKDNIERNTVNTYKSFNKLERLSREAFKKYARMNNIDYEYITSSNQPNYNSAHWLRMEMFNRPEYDEILYVDCDVLINKLRMKDNIFEVEGNGVNRLNFYTYEPYKEINMGVFKFNKEQAKIMKDNIDKYYHPTHNQKVMNQCWWDNIGEMKYLPYRYNVTHKPTDDITFRHYAGSWKSKEQLKQCPIWRQYK